MGRSRKWRSDETIHSHLHPLSPPHVARPSRPTAAPLTGAGVLHLTPVGAADGATDPLGFAAVEGKVHIHDLHATILHLLGLDHK
ncbi:MAG TPA: DUF1501 domain-containing protein, partial [Myxococcales bacterium]|nr:DUF1501 domain-containing protein [Myxococcales bacterium]